MRPTFPSGGLRPRRVLTAVCVLVAGAGASTAVTAQAPAGHAQASAGERARIVIGLERGVSQREGGALLRRDGAKLRRFLGALRAASATVPAARRDEILARLRARPAVRFAEVDRPVALERPFLGARLPIAQAARKPNDDGFVYQYGLDQDADHDIDATKAWEKRTQCSKVAVLDTGVDVGHSDLKANLWRNGKEKPGNGKDDDKNGYIDDDRGADIIDGRGSGEDHQGHGTHVAGIIAAIGNNGRGVSGLCWKSPIISVRFMDAAGRGYSSDAAEGIVYAVDHGAHVINASYGATQPSDVERDAVQYAAKHDTLIVAAAGNEHVNIDKTPLYPAAYSNENVLTVAASTAKDKPASFSNYGKKNVDLAAPGDEIASTANGGKYVYMSGTSMAAPFVAAAAAMVRKHGGGLPFKKVRKVLLNSSDDKSAFKDKVATGGRLNIKRALNAAK